MYFKKIRIFLENKSYIKKDRNPSNITLFTTPYHLFYLKIPFKIASLMSNYCSHESLPLFSLHVSHMNICYYR